MRSGVASAEPGGASSPFDLESRFASLEERLEQRREADLRFVLDQIQAAEVRSGAAIGENSNAIRYIALASDPAITEW